MPAVTTTAHAGAVASIYEAFGRRDIPGVLAHLSEDVTWDVTDVPWTPHAARVPG